MFLPRDGIALVGGGSILGQTHGSLLAMTSTPSLVVEAESEHKKFAGTGANAGNAGKSKWAAPRA